MTRKYQPDVACLLLLAACLCSLTPWPARATDRQAADARPGPETPLREIFVPVEDLHVVLASQPQRVFLSRAEYQDLLKKAIRPAPEPVPRQAILVSAEYEAVLKVQRATLQSTLVFEVLADGIHVIQLPFDGVGLSAARLDGRPAPLGRSSSGSVSVFLEGVGRHELELELVTPVQTATASQTLRVIVPTAPATRLTVEVPGNVELRSGAAVLSRELDMSADTTKFELLPPRGPWSLVFSLNNRILQSQRVVTVRNSLVDEITRAYERLHCDFSFDVLQGSATEFRFRIPESFEITKIDSPLLARWEIGSTAEATRQLTVRLREPTTGKLRISISATRNSTFNGETWELPQITPLDVLDQIAVVGLLVEEQLQADSIASTGLIEIDTNVLRSALPESVFRAEPGAPRLRPVAAFYAPANQFKLGARFQLPAASVQSFWQMRLTVRDESLEIEGFITLSPQVDPLFLLELTVPAPWHLGKVTTIEGEPLPMVRLTGDVEKVRIHFPHAVAAGDRTRMQFTASAVPDNWLGSWNETTITFPKVTLDDAPDVAGAIAIQPDGDFEILPESTNGLLILDPAGSGQNRMNLEEHLLAYRFSDGNYQARFTVRRRQPLITARTYQFFELTPFGLTAHYELIYGVSGARTRQLTFQLPPSAPPDISLNALGAAQVQSFYREGDGDDQRWHVRLRERAIGQVRLSVRYQQNLSDEQGELDLPLLQVDDVAYATDVVAVEGSSEMEITIQTEARRLDVGELVDAQHPTGRRLLGVFGLPNQDTRVGITYRRRPAYGLPASLVQRCELVTSLDRTGLSQTSARYLLRTKANYLEITLPANAELWAATVDGEAAAPQREGERLLLEIPPAPATQLRDLQLTYELPATGSGLLTRVNSSAPILVVRDEQGPGYQVPVADVLWHVVLPSGQSLVRTDGTVYRDTRPDATSPLLVVWKTIRILGGGFNPFFQAARERATNAKIAARYSAVDAESTEAHVPGPRMGQPPTAQSGADEAANEAAAPARESDAPATDSPGTRTTPLKNEYWALQGVRSLPIKLESSGESLRFRSMGASPRLEAFLINRTQATFLSWMLMAIVLAVGVTFVHATWKRKLALILTAALLCLLLPTLLLLTIGFEVSVIFHRGFYASLCLVPIYFVLHAAGSVRSALTRLGQRVPATTACWLLLTTLLCSSGFAQSPRLEEWSSVFRAPEPIVVPDDAVIVPYDPATTDGVPRGDRLFVPYTKYIELLEMANPSELQVENPPPADYAWAGASYQTTLTTRADGRDELLIEGTLHLQVYSVQALDVPLPIEQAVLTAAKLDGKNAKISVLAPRAASPEVPASQVQASQEQASRPFPPSVLAVHVEGRGPKQLQLTLRVRLATAGGWQTVRCRLPHATANALEVFVPTAGTEIALRGGQDRTTFETNQAAATLQTVLPADGWLQMQWRERVANNQIDQTLTAHSVVLFDVAEDGIRLTWQANLESRRAERERFTLVVPADYFVEGVAGDNVRGFDAKSDGEQQRIDVELLEPITGQETLIVSLTREIDDHDATGATSTTAAIESPGLRIAGALLHQGSLLVRRSPHLDLRTSEAVGLQRAETASQNFSQLSNSVDSGGPWGLRPHQAWRFANDAYRLEMLAQTELPDVVVETDSLLKLSNDTLSLEARLRYHVNQRPIYRTSIELPADFALDHVAAPGTFEQSFHQEEDGIQRLELYFHQGLEGSFSVIVRGSVPIHNNAAVPLPRVRITGTQQSGYFVIQTDPGFEVETRQLQNCQNVLLQSVTDWLTPEQRVLARSVLRYRAPTYSGELRLVARTPRVSSFSVTNLRVTSREIQTTIFMQFTILEAGVRELTFVLPAWMEEARWTVPLLRQKRIEPVDGQDGLVRVHLDLQEEVIQQLIVVAEFDRPLRSTDIETPLPQIETGRVDDQFVVLENVGRDEVVVQSQTNVREITPQQPEWRDLASVLDDSVTRAYLVTAPASQAGMTFQTRQRTKVRTAEARIRLAETILMMDANGTYRGQQTYHVDNRTEPFLEVELPNEAVLWTATVDGSWVKPARAGNAGAGRVRIPLPKTAAGDLDYRVQLKYGGEMEQPGKLDRVTFPLIHTVNIPVEQSQVRLRLPESHTWFGFDGTMRRVPDEGDLAAGSLLYRTQQIESLSRVLSRDDVDEFSKVRAANNLKKVVEEATEFQKAIRGRFASNARVQQQISDNALASQTATEQISDLERQVRAGRATVNRDRLLLLFTQQPRIRGENVVESLGMNFTEPMPQANSPAEQRAGGKRFDNRWLMKNDLAADPTADRDNHRVLRGIARKAVRQKEEAQQQLQTYDFLTEDKQQRGTARRPASQPGGDELQQQLQRYQSRLEDEKSSQPVEQGRGGMLGAVTTYGAVADRDVVQIAPLRAAAGFASLEVSLPTRGVEYLFTTPRGEIALQARAVKSQRLFSAIRVAGLLALFAGLGLAIAGGRKLHLRLGRRTLAAILILLGTVSLLGFLPVFGGLAIVVGFWLLLTKSPAEFERQL